MLEKIKNYIVLIAVAISGMLYLLLNRSNKKVATLQLEKASITVEKDLANVSKKASDSKTQYVNSSNIYTQYRKSHPGVFKR